MYLTKEKKEEIFAQYGKSAKDSGTTEAQIALFTYRIQHLTELMKQNKKDQVSERASSVSSANVVVCLTT